MSLRSLVLLLVICSVVSCKKGGGDAPAIPPKGSFTISPMSSNLEYLGRGLQLYLFVDSITNSTETIRISLADLPPGITVEEYAPSGKPPFSTKFELTADFTTPKGTFPIKVIGTSPSEVKEYPLNLTIRNLNEWDVDSNKTFGGRLEVNLSGSGNNMGANFNGSGIFVLFKKYATIDSISRSYKVVNKLSPDTGEVLIRVSDGWKDLVSLPAGKKVDVTYLNGRFSIRGVNIPVIDSSTLQTKTLSFELGDD